MIALSIDDLYTAHCEQADDTAIPEVDPEEMTYGVLSITQETGRKSVDDSQVGMIMVPDVSYYSFDTQWKVDNQGQIDESKVLNGVQEYADTQLASNFNNNYGLLTIGDLFDYLVDVKTDSNLTTAQRACDYYKILYPQPHIQLTIENLKNMSLYGTTRVASTRDDLTRSDPYNDFYKRPPLSVKGANDITYTIQADNGSLLKNGTSPSSIVVTGNALQYDITIPYLIGYYEQSATIDDAPNAETNGNVNDKLKDAGIYSLNFQIKNNYSYYEGHKYQQIRINDIEYPVFYTSVVANRTLQDSYTVVDVSLKGHIAQTTNAKNIFRSNGYGIKITSGTFSTPYNIGIKSTTTGVSIYYGTITDVSTDKNKTNTFYIVPANDNATSTNRNINITVEQLEKINNVESTKKTANFTIIQKPSSRYIKVTLQHAELFNNTGNNMQIGISDEFNHYNGSNFGFTVNTQSSATCSIRIAPDIITHSAFKYNSSNRDSNADSHFHLQLLTVTSINFYKIGEALDNYSSDHSILTIELTDSKGNNKQTIAVNKKHFQKQPDVSVNDIKREKASYFSAKGETELQYINQAFINYKQFDQSEYDFYVIHLYAIAGGKYSGGINGTTELTTSLFGDGEALWDSAKCQMCIDWIIACSDKAANDGTIVKVGNRYAES